MQCCSRYFRNNVLHLTATAAWVACCFLNNRRMARASIVRLGRLIYPYIQAELFLPWSMDEFAAHLNATIDFFVARGLLEADAENSTLTRGAGQSDGAFQLRVIAQTLLQAIERYYIGDRRARAQRTELARGPGTGKPVHADRAATIAAA